MTDREGQVELRPTAIVAVDVVLFTVRPAETVDESWQVLLVQRDDTAFAGKLSLPGVLVRADETFDAAARRALHSKAGLDAAGWYLEQLGTFGTPARDTWGRVVSVAHLALQRSDELTLAPGGGITRAIWTPVRQVSTAALAFDHADMLRVAANRAQAKLRYSWLAFQVLPEAFTLPALRSVYAAILDPTLARLNTGNFKRAFAALFVSGALAPVGRRAVSGRVGRPGELYRFDGPLAGTWNRELPWQEDDTLWTT